MGKKILGWGIWLGVTALTTTAVLVVIRQIGPLQKWAGVLPPNKTLADWVKGLASGNKTT